MFRYHELDEFELPVTDGNNLFQNTPANSSPQEYQTTVDSSNLGLDLSFLEMDTPVTSPSQFLNDLQPINAAILGRGWSLPEASAPATSPSLVHAVSGQNLGTSETAYPSTSSASPVFPEAQNCSQNPESDSLFSRSIKEPQTVMGSTSKAPVNQKEKQLQDKLKEKRQREAARVKNYRDKKKKESIDNLDLLHAARRANYTALFNLLSKSHSLQQKAKTLWTTAGKVTFSGYIDLVTTERYNHLTEVENLTVEIENFIQMLKYYTEASKKEPESFTFKELLTENENLRKVLESVRFKNDELKRQIELLEIYISRHSLPTSPVEADGRISPRDGYEMVIECF